MFYFFLNFPASFFEKGESPLIIGFLAAQGSEADGCLYRAACKSPNTAREYSRAARAVLQGADIFKASTTDKRYNEMIYNVDRAVLEGVEGAPCEAIYPCYL